MGDKNSGSLTWDVVVLGAGGKQSQAMLQAAARAGRLDRWLCVDKAWSDEARERTEAFGAKTQELDVFADKVLLAQIVGDTQLVANMVGPYFRTMGPVLDACIRAGSDYIDICDDADAVELILKRDEEVTVAGIRVLTGMGASPGITNVLAKSAMSIMGTADAVDISWSSDARDASPAVIEHMWHIFEPWHEGGSHHGVPRWEELQHRTIDFRSMTGPHWLVELAHSELVTLPKFLDVERVSNFGGLAPQDLMVVAWAQARMGAGQGGEGASAQQSALTEACREVFMELADELKSTPRTYGGMRIDVTRKGNGIRFESASMATMEDSTGTPAAAGILLMLDRALESPGISAPECLEPIDFFDSLAAVSRGSSGALEVWILDDGEAVERVSFRDVLNRDEQLCSKLRVGKSDNRD